MPSSIVVVTLVLSLSLQLVFPQDVLLVPAVFTPFDQNGALNTKAIQSYCDFLLKNNITTVFISGTNGESLSTTFAERKQVIDAWVTASVRSGSRMSIIVHVGSESIMDAMDLAEYTQFQASATPGVITAIASQPPSFFRPSTIDALIRFLAPVAAKCSLPLYYYHIPSLSNVNLPMDQFVTAARAAIPTFNGVKYTDPDTYTYSKVLREMNPPNKPGTVFFGKDEMFLSAISMGGNKFVGSTYNFLAPCAYRMASFYYQGNMTHAQMEQARVQTVVDLILPNGAAIAAQKAIMKMKGIDLGSVRPPLPFLTVAQTQALQAALTKEGFFEWS
jgi:N-acetylneuraminate lyase